MSLLGVALRGMLITLSVYTAILALMLWAMQVGGVLPPAGTPGSVGRPSATHRILSAVHRADRRRRLPAVRHRELVRQHSNQGHDVHRLGAAPAVRDCRRVAIASQSRWQRRDQRRETALALARGGRLPGRRRRVPHPPVVGQGRLRPGAQRLARGSQMAVPRAHRLPAGARAPAHRPHVAGGRLERAARLSIHLHAGRRGAVGRPVQFAAGRDRRGLPVHRRPRQEVHFVRILHAAHPADFRAAGVRHPARGLFDRAGGRGTSGAACSASTFRCWSSSASRACSPASS